jgi:hypothetical protein
MPLTALQSYNIEKALSRGQTIEAIKLYREARNCSLTEAKVEIDRRLTQLKIDKPWYFKELRTDTSHQETKKISFNKNHLALFFLADALLFGGLLFYFVFNGGSPTNQHNTISQTVYTETPSKGRPKAAPLPPLIEANDYSAAISATDTFDSLYRDTLSDAEFVAIKNPSKKSSLADCLLEKKIKTARSLLAQQRNVPANTPLTEIANSPQQPKLDGIIQVQEWDDATPIIVDDEFETTLYLKTDGKWLFIACDTPRETSQGGYDQLRVYFHTGLNDNLLNERIHIGRHAGITSIRQTNFRWQGKPPESDGERWKKYPINDWGIYRSAQGTSSMASGHRQYEAAIHLGEAGLHPGTAFTVYVEVETDPLKNGQGKFLERQYLGELGDEHNPRWMMF